MNSIETNPEILEARKKLAEKFGNMKLGGKGNLLVYSHHFYIRISEKKGSPQAQVFRRSRQEDSVPCQEGP